MKKEVLRYFLMGFMIIVILVVFCIINDSIDYSRKSTFEYLADTNEYAYQIENMTFEDEDLVISGWFFSLKKVQNEYREVDTQNSIGIVLYDKSQKEEKNIDGSNKHKKGIALSTTMYTRTDINNYFKCEFDYSQCGFTARIKKSEVSLEDKQYQIIIKPDQDSLGGICTETYIDYGKLIYIDPDAKIVLDVERTDLKSIIESGYCLVSCPEYGIYVYQNKRKLYWIADENYYFEDDGSTYIQLHFDTTQFDRLPIYRTYNGWFWDDLGGAFEDYEITNEINCGKYRVAMREIPKEYSITRIGTGYKSAGSWIWQKYFRPISLYDMSFE